MARIVHRVGAGDLMIVREHMETDLLTVSPAETCERALMLMTAAGIDTLPVTEGQRLVGMVSELDIRRHAPARISGDGRREVEPVLPYARIGGVMRISPPMISARAALREAAQRMRDDNLSLLPVVDEGRLVGLLTHRALFDALVHLLDDASNGRRGDGASAHAHHSSRTT